MAAIRKTCPLCGGKIIVSFLYQVPHDYGINKRTGKLCKTRLPFSGHHTEEAAIAFCENQSESCSAYWDDDEFALGSEDEFIDYKYLEGET